MDLDAVAGELYDTAPEEFVALRTAKAAEAKAGGDRALAKQLTALRRPTRSAWIVNLITRNAAEELTGLLDLAAAITEAQQRLSGEELRQLSRQRHAAIAALVHRGTQLAEVRGHTPTEATRREVSETLQAALSDPGIAAEVRAGRLTQPKSYGGFGPQFAAAPAQPTAPSEQPGPRETESGDSESTGTESGESAESQQDAGAADRESEREAQHAQLVEELSLAQETYDRLTDQLERAEALARRATELAEQKAGRVEDLRQQLSRAERDSERAEDDRQRLTDNRDRLQQEQGRAETAVSEALERLADG